MKKLLVFVSTIIFLSAMNPIISNANGQPELSEKCIKEMKERNEALNKEIMQDIILSFKLDIDEYEYHELSYRDLVAAHIVYGGKQEDKYYHSLTKLFDTTGGSFGEPRLYVRPQTAYFLFKGADKRNNMILLELRDNKWEVVEKKTTEGKDIEYKRVKCEREYIKKKKEYYGDNN